MPKIEKDAKLDAIVVATLARARPQCVQSRVNWGNAHEYLLKERKIANAARRVTEIKAARKRVTKAAPELKEVYLIGNRIGDAGKAALREARKGLRVYS